MAAHTGMDLLTNQSAQSKAAANRGNQTVGERVADKIERSQAIAAHRRIPRSVAGVAIRASLRIAALGVSVGVEDTVPGPSDELVGHLVGEGDRSEESRG